MVINIDAIDLATVIDLAEPLGYKVGVKPGPEGSFFMATYTIHKDGRAVLETRDFGLAFGLILGLDHAKNHLRA